MADESNRIDNWKDFHGPNAGYVVELYERYRRDPDAVDAATRSYFEQWAPPPLEPIEAPIPAFEKIMGAVNLASAIREYGHLAARLDPLGSPPPGDPSLDPAAHGVSEEDLRRLPASLVGGPIAGQADNAWQAIQALRRVYSSTTGYDYDHLRIPEEREWLRHAAETGRFRPPRAPIDRIGLLERLTQVETFERFLQRSFPGKTRFSIEGLDVIVPMLDQIIAGAAELEICTILIGMAHRGRLNVLAHVLQKPYAQILAEFQDPVWRPNFGDELGWTGDVKYHKGERHTVAEDAIVDMIITMPPNPSHLEAVAPVVEGMARAAQVQVDRPGPPRFHYRACLPVLIHGDASFPAQGVTAETLNLHRLPGYHTGGTLHIIANNQLGFTTEPEAGRSTLYASDLAKGFKIPIVHVNADDPVACIEVARLASAYRDRFQKDFLIDLIGYRRYGHNEGDEPSFTQPLLYRVIDTHPGVREQWAAALVEEGAIPEELPEELVRRYMQALQEVLDSLEPKQELLEPRLEPPPPGTARRARTAVPAKRLRELNRSLWQLPDGFALNSKLERALRRRREALEKLDEPAVDWATAEMLAFASILADATAIRLTGQDTERGTFSQRHAAFHDVETGAAFVPLQSLPQAGAAFEMHNSPLSESAALGFEFGYNIAAPERMVVWEAQYGDFINNAQAVIDEFISTGRAKWEQTPSLVLLLPHGYEGQGPDHSSGRPERFLELAAETNMRIANCTTAAQYFHLLRRQAALLKSDPLPLIVFTPKSLLRHPRVASPPRELAQGRWQPVIDDPGAQTRAKEVRCLILCSGKVFVDLDTAEQRDESPGIAVVRVEQLYPFPAQEIEAVLEAYPNLEEVIWVQEEPENMGAWTFMRPCLEAVIHGRWPLRYVGRPPSSSPAEGSTAWHRVNQAALIKLAYDAQSIRDKLDEEWVKTE
jgi:2-oxoglutarate dehydrogenase E1 component